MNQPTTTSITGTPAVSTIVFVFPMIGFTGGAATTAVQVGYTVADVVAKAVFGVLIFMIAARKTELEASPTR